MKNPIWKDTTSWSRNDSVEKRQTPREWSLDTGDLSITVHHLHGINDAIWFLSCHEIGISSRELGEVSAEEAKSRAVFQVRAELAHMMDSIPE